MLAVTLRQLNALWAVLPPLGGGGLARIPAAMSLLVALGSAIYVLPLAASPSEAEVVVIAAPATVDAEAVLAAELAAWVLDQDGDRGDLLEQLAVAAADDPTSLAADPESPLETSPVYGSAAGAMDSVTPSAPLRPLVEHITTYRVAPGDTIYAVARRFGISVETLLWANPLPDPDTLWVGHQLTVLPVSGVLHPVAVGDTIANVAQRYRLPAAALTAANGLWESQPLRPGQRLLVPNGRPLPPRVTAPVVAYSAPALSEQYKRQFLLAAAAAAQQSQRNTRVPAAVTMAQAILESDWGRSRLTREANNYFGIKASSGWRGEVYWIETWEVVDGEDVIVREPFRVYADQDASFRDHGLFFVQNSRYAAALRVVADSRAFAQAIADAGYATDPYYAAKLISIMDQYDLYQYDLS